MSALPPRASRARAASSSAARRIAGSRQAAGRAAGGRPGCERPAAAGKNCMHHPRGCYVLGYVARRPADH